jgi:hypothetical protein
MDGEQEPDAKRQKLAEQVWHNETLVVQAADQSISFGR